MANRAKTGKAQLIKGSIIYIWEEIKTLNKTKLKALKIMFAGYIQMKLIDRKKPVIKRKPNQITLVER